MSAPVVKKSCPFKDVLGKPGEGVHVARFLGMARNDLLLTVILAIIIVLIFMRGSILSMVFKSVAVFGVLILLSVIVHKLFCVDTTLTLKVFKKNI
jgi:hypothetical protein